MWRKMIQLVSLDFHKTVHTFLHSGPLKKLNTQRIEKSGLEWVNRWVKLRKQGKNKWSLEVIIAH